MKARKINYNLIQKKVNELHKNIKKEASPIIVIAELLDNGSYEVKENIKNGKQKQLKFINETEFNKYLDTLENCTVIIDDWIKELDQDTTDEVIKNMSVEELKILAKDDCEANEKEFDKTLIKNIKKLI